MQSPILTRLRNETSEAHVRLEDEIKIEDRIQSVDGYRSLLEDFYGFYQPIESALESQSGWGFDIQERRKSQWIREDLRALGLSEEEIDALPRCEEIPAVNGLADGYGAAYVIEGSTLGGRTITGLLEKSEIPADGRRFFRSYEAELGTKWKEFCAAMEAYSSDTNSDHIVEGAKSTFTRMHQWVSRGRV